MRSPEPAVSRTQEATTQLDAAPVGAVIRIALALFLVATLIGVSIWIVLPFVGAIVWGAIIAISIYPMHLRLTASLGARHKASAIVLGIVMALVLLVPVIFLFLTIGEHAEQAANALSSIKQFTVPPLPAWLGDLPLVGDRISKLWHQAEADLPGTIESVRPQLRAALLWLLSRVAASSLTVLEAILAVVTASIFLITGPQLKTFFIRLLERLGAPDSASHVAAVERTVHAVSQGVIGTAFIQAVLLWVGYALAGAPFPIFLAFLGFVFCSIQIGVLLIGLPVAAWMFWGQGETGAAIFVLGWTIFVNLIDTVIKPVLIGRDFPVPIWVGFVGVIGGLLAMGLIGLFIGPIILSVSYRLLINWTHA
jgi:predicted PurR-regulated permease PerM